METSNPESERKDVNVTPEPVGAGVGVQEGGPVEEEEETKQ